MQYQVFIQNHSEKRFIASIVSIPNCTVEGNTKEEAIALGKTAFENQLANGELVTIEVESQQMQQENDPWIRNIGIFADDPTFDDFLAEMAAYRQLVDAQEVEE